MALTATERRRMEAAAQPFPSRRSGLIPALRIIQESRGHVDKQAMIDVADFFELHPMQVEEVVTFYTMFSVKPLGKYHLQVCRSISCFIMGCNSIIRHLEGRLGIVPGQTTGDGRFTLSTVECIGACGTAPAMQINEAYHDRLSVEAVDRILADL